MNTLFTPKFYLQLNQNPALQELINRLNCEVIPHPSIESNRLTQVRIKQIIQNCKAHPRRQPEY